MSPQSSRTANLLIIAALVAIFITDLATMAGFAHGMLYVLVVLIAMLTERRGLIVAVAAISSMLIVIGVMFSPSAPESFPDHYVLANRGVSILVVICAALLAVARQNQVENRRQAEQQLASTGRMLRLASEVAHIGGWTVRLDPPAVHWTQEVHRIHGTEPGDEPDLKTAIEFYAPRDRDRIQKAFDRCIGEGMPFDEELQIIDTRGQPVWVRAVGEPSRDAGGHIIGAHGAFMNIDRSKRLALRLTRTLESITDAFFLLDRDWRFSFLNKRAEVVLERSRNELLGRVVWDEFPDAVDSPFQHHYEKAMSTGESISFQAHYAPLKRWFEVHAYPSEDGLAVYFQDITARRQADQHLHLLEAAINRINDQIIITEAAPINEPGPRILYVNPAFEQQTGYTAEEVIGRSPRFLQGPESPRAPLDRIRECISQARSVRIELCNYTKRGTLYHSEVDISPVFDDDNQVRYFVAVQRDITARLQMQEQLRQSQRLEAVGQLTGGIAHDFNNLLTVILGNAELLRDELSSDATLSDISGMVVKAAQRGAELTQRLLAFARRQALEPRAIDVNRTVRHMDELLRRSLGNHIEVELTCGGGLWPALVDEAQLENALLNLCLNSRDAMPQGGRLTIETANARLDDEYAAGHEDVQPGQYVMVAVSDTGRGIVDEDLPRVFEPFFTTKEKGKGTGLGLSMIYGFVKQSGGHIKIYSEIDEGTTVRMYLPRATAADSVADVILAEPVGESGSEHILLVEDDEMVRQFVSRQLRELGYRVTVAANGEEALDLLDRHHPVDLLFTDVVMPGGMSGRELADQARQRDPLLKVLYTSGYTENAIVHHGRLDPDVQLLSKPYRRAELARRIRQTLNSPPDKRLTGEKPND